MRHTFRSLAHRNFRIYFFGQLISLSGTWMQGTALSWLVWRLTKSSVALAAVDCAALLPLLIFGLLGGMVADRAHRRSVLLVTQSLAMTQAVVLACLTVSGQLQVWHAIVLSAVLGTVNAFEVPSRQALLVSLIDKENLVNAISLNSSLFNSARAIGPALAAMVVTVSSEGTCFVLNSVSYLAALLAIAMLRVEKRVALHDDSVAASLSAGLKFAMAEPSIRRVLCLAAVVSLFGLQYSMLMPIFAAEVLHGDVRTLGALRAAAGIGAFVAALTLANRGHGEYLKKAVGFASFTFGVAVLGFALSTNFWISQLLAFIAGFAMTTQLSGGHSLIQLAVTDKLRGRVMSIYMTLMLGISPLTSMPVGYAARAFGAPLTMVFCASVCLMAGLVYLVTLPRPGLQPVNMD